jgi:hypothetical protein
VSVPLSQLESLDRADEPVLSVRPRRPWRPHQHLLLGAVGAIVVLILRSAGILVGPAAIAVVVLCFIFAPGPRRTAERYLLFLAIGLGWLPLLGWIPGLGTSVDVPGILLAIAVGVTCAHQARLERTRSRSLALPTPAELVGLLVGIAVALWWALPIGRLSLSGRLQWLFAGWDNDTHFSIFQENLRLGSFIHVRPNVPGGGARVGYDYPQGMHQAFAQLARLWDPHAPLTLSWLLNAYLVMLILTVGGIVTLGCLAIARLCQRDLLAALPAMAIIVALFGVGRFGPFNGFPNYELAIVASAVAVTLMVRPTLSPRANFFVVAGLGLIVVYNWYPLIILAVPAIVVAAWKAMSAVSGRARVLTAVAIGAIGIAYVMPFTLFLHRGAKTLNEVGGGVVPPWGLLMVCLAALVVVAIVRQARRSDWTTNVIIAAPALLGGGAIAVLIAYEDRSTGFASYYGQKFAAGVFAVTLTVLVCVLASELAESRLRLKLSLPIAIVATALISLAALEIDGYVGPYAWSQVIGGNIPASSFDAAGLVLHNELNFAAPQSAEAESVLDSAQIARSSGSGQWWYVDPISQNSFAFFAEWFDILVGNPTQASYDHVGNVLAPVLDAPPTPDVAAQLIVQNFPRPEDGRVHLFVSSYIRGRMIQLDPAWARPGALLTIQTP